MSSRKSKISEDKAELRQKLTDFIEKKLDGRQVRLAEAIGANEADVSYWLKTGGAPAWAILKIFELYPDARDFFLSGKDPEPALDLEREDLVRRFTELIKEGVFWSLWSQQIKVCEDARAKHQEKELGSEARALQLFDSLKTDEQLRFAELVQERAGKYGPKEVPRATATAKEKSLPREHKKTHGRTAGSGKKVKDEDRQ